MAIAVPTTASTNYTAGETVTITKPTSLAEGELMIACISARSGSSPTINTASGWTLMTGSDFTNGSLSIQWKIATAGDVAASDFSFTHTDTGNGFICGAILRVTGATPTPADTDDADTNATANSATLSFVAAATPSFDGSLILMILNGDLGGVGTGTIGTYVTTPSLTWTEVLDTSVDSGTADPITGVAYAIQSTAAQITAYGATFSATRNEHTGILGVFKPLINASVSLDALSLTGTVNAFTATGGANVTLDQIALTATPNDMSAVEATPKWSNTDKSSPSSFTNTDKS